MAKIKSSLKKTETNGLIDSHNHLQDPRLAPFLKEVLDRAGKEGISTMFSCGTSEADWPSLRQLAREDKMVVPFFGLHPWFTEQRTPDWLTVLKEILETIPSGVGETGLDKWLIGFEPAVQEEVFTCHLELAIELVRPVAVHCVRAWGRMLEILRTFGPFDIPVIIHSFGGSAEMVAPLIDLGCYLSFSGSITDIRKERIRQALLQVPLDRLLVETDAPDLLPEAEARAYCLHTEQGILLNEPANLPAIINQIAVIRKQDKETIRQATVTNGLTILTSIRNSGSIV